MKKAMAVQKEVKKQEAPTPLRLPKEVKEKLEKQAKKENRRLGNMIVTILKEYYGIE